MLFGFSFFLPDTEREQSPVLVPICASDRRMRILVYVLPIAAASEYTFGLKKNASLKKKTVTNEWSLVTSAAPSQ